MSSEQVEGEMMGYSEAARFIGVPVGTMYGWVHSRFIPHVRLGPRLVRFSRSSLSAWLQARAVNVVSV